MMRFAGTLSKPGTVTVGGNPATMNSDNTQFEGYASVAANTTTQVHVIVTDGDGNVTDQHADITPDMVASQAFTYDLNGNTTASGPAGAPTATYGWDAADRLISVTIGSNVTTYDYDGAGRRVREKVNGAETRHWVWCGLALCEERAADNTVAKRFYAQGEQISGVSYYFTRDHLGSVRELLDSSGTAATGGLHARYDYDLFGARVSNSITTNPVESDFGFTGHLEFSFSGLEILGAPLRFYQPAVARWLSRDPIAEAGGGNLYGYVENRPIVFFDPFGLDNQTDETDYWMNDGALHHGNPGPAGSNSGLSLPARAAQIVQDTAREGVLDVASALIPWDGIMPLIGDLSNIVFFGKEANQIFHTWRHVDEKGLCRQKVQDAILAELEKITGNLQTGEINNLTVVVDGKTIVASAYKLNNGAINVGRIVVK